MKPILLTIITLFLSFNVFSQDKIKGKIKKSIPLLTRHLTAGLSSEKEKVEAIYKWITENIDYDYDKLDNSKHFTGEDPKRILKQKKAICGGYVELTRAMLAEAGIKSETITGYIHDTHWSPGKLVVSETHAWMSIKVDGKWLFADPTWDAGYIGRIPIKRKPYSPKKYKKTEWKKESKTLSKLNKRKEKEALRKEKYDEKPKFTNDIGFVKYPGREFYLMTADTFLLSHLPLLPAWQLRDDVLTIEEFSQSSDSIKKILESKTKTNNKSIKSIKEYSKENFLEQLIINGEKGDEFNHYNPGIKTLYYYNYLSLVQSKDLQRLARGSQYEITKSKYPELAAKNDTILKYVSSFKSFEKNKYKSDKAFDKDEYKLTQSFDKGNTKLISKVKSLNEKYIDKIESNTTTVKSSLEKTKEIKDQIATNYEKSINYSKPKKIKDKYLTPWLDSVEIYNNKIKEYFYLLDTLRSHTKFKTVLNLCSNLEYLYEVNADYIQFNSYSTKEITDEIDSLISVRATRTINIFNDSILLELINKNVFSDYKQLLAISKLAKADFKKLENDNKLDIAYKYELNIQSEIYKTTQLMETYYLKSLSFNEQVVNALEVNNKNIKKLLKLGEEQVDLKESKYEFISDKTEKSNTRSSSLVEQIKKDSKEWKNKFKS